MNQFKSSVILAVDVEDNLVRDLITTCITSSSPNYFPSSQIMFVENKRLTATLLQDIDENQLPETYGGKMQLVPIQDA